MIRTLLLLGCVIGAAAAGMSEARAVAVLEAPRVAAPTSEPLLTSVGFKRQAFHRGSGGFRKKFHASHAFAGKRLGHGGVVVRKAFAGPRFSPRSPLRRHGISAKRRSAGAGFVVGERFRKGDVIHGRRSIQLRLFGKHFRDGRILARKHSFGPRFSIEKTFVDHRLFGGKRLTSVGKGVLDPRFFRSKRFGHARFFSGRALHRLRR